MNFRKMTSVMALIIFSSATETAISQTCGKQPETVRIELPQPHRCQQIKKTPQVSYNFASTVLNVSFPGNGQGGKVEIYRNGVKVVNTSAPAGASLSYVLRNYGAGDYTIVVSQGNTVVYSRTMKIK